MRQLELGDSKGGEIPPPEMFRGELVPERTPPPPPTL